MATSPFKFLNPYTTDDRELFFGREKEVRILLSDIVVNRLVVLFARTGTGKTSIINAGVRPRLEERGYETFFIRVNRDPVESARTELTSRLKADRGSEPFPAWLEGVAARLERPVLLCFDQFEEFFIHGFDRRRGRGRQFISDVAELFNNSASRVHLLFSMREEWFVWMDEFRDEIPSIFHSESNLRLRWFDAAQATDAILKPPRAFGVDIDPALAARIVSRLDSGGGIEPAQLQIVCDTLWRGRPPGATTIGIADYERLGLEAAGTAVAAHVLYERFETDFLAIESKAELDLLRRLLPELRTPREPYTKYVRDVSGLASTLGVTEDVMLRLIERLESFGFVRKSLRDGLVTVELTHDYLIEHFGILEQRIRGLWPRKLIGRAHQEQRFATAEEIEVISDGADVLVLDRQDTEWLLRSALETGNRASLWFTRARALGIDAWRVVSDRLKAAPPAYAAVRLLAQLDDQQSVELLRDAIADARLAGPAIEALSDLKTIAAVETLASTMNRADLRAQAQVALGWMASSREAAVAAAAARALEEAKKAETPPAVDRRRPPLPIVEMGEWPERSLSEKIPVPAMAEQLVSGRIIPVLGAGAVLAGRPGDTSWHTGSEFAPTHNELADLLAARVDLREQVFDLATIASYYSLINGYSQLNGLVRDVYRRASSPNPIAQYLAALKVPLLVVTTMLDTSVERAFTDSGKRFHGIVHQRGDRRGSRVGWIRPGATRPETIDSNRLVIDEEDSVVYKVCGSFDADGDSVFITEDDLVDLISRLMAGGMPAAVMMRIRTGRLLFLGYSVNNWFPRSLLRIMSSTRDDRLSEAWAVSARSSRFEEAVWRDRSVKQYEGDLTSFIDELRRYTEYRS